jgi:hypothetical protein
VEVKTFFFKSPTPLATPTLLATRIGHGALKLSFYAFKK